MNSYDFQTPEPRIKFELSPAESFMSAPGGDYSSLFESSPLPSTMNPRDIMTPESTQADDGHHDVQSAGNRTAASSQTPEPNAAEKKPTKKRKSWGQVLPEPKTNLPPRKRAKTEDEKEQRRVERVLRNRRAAQSSRERKRQEVEALEKQNQELASKLEQANRVIQQLLSERRGSSGSSASLDALHPNPITFSKELFNSQDGHLAATQSPATSPTTSALMDSLMMSQAATETVNPASISPTLYPVPEEDEEANSDEAAPPAAAEEKTSLDATQLPAVKLCSPDLQCRSAEVPPPQRRPTAASAHQQQQQQLQLFLFLSLFLQRALISATMACRRPLQQVAMSTRSGFSLPPTPAILNTIIWLVTTRRHSTRSTSTSASTSRRPTTTSSVTTASAAASSAASTASTTASPRSPTLRLRTLRRILSCSPHLARPLRDATLAVLRLAVSKKASGAGSTVGGASGWTATTTTTRGAGDDDVDVWDDDSSEYMKYVPASHKGRLPSVEALFTLAWICEVQLKRQEGLLLAGSQVKTGMVMTGSKARFPGFLDTKPSVQGGWVTDSQVL